MQAVLEGDGYTVTTACDGEEALAVMDREHIDLVVLDIMMPNMDGYEFTKTLRSANNEMPILMVSAKQLSEDRKKGFLVGTDDYMTKPVDTEEMLLRIQGPAAPGKDRLRAEDRDRRCGAGLRFSDRHPGQGTPGAASEGISAAV